MPFARGSDPNNRWDRRSFLRLAACAGTGLLVPVRRSWGAAISPDLAELARMDFEVTYRTEIRDLPRDARRLDVWMPLPPENSAQRIRDLSVACRVPYEITREGAYGNRILHVGFASNPKPFSVEARYQMMRHQVGIEPAELEEQSLEKYLRLVPPVRATPEVEAFAARVIGRSEDPHEIGRRVFSGIIDLLTYDKEIPGCGIGDTAWIMRHRRGKCDDYHALFMTVMISRGIPVRWEQGFPLPLPSSETGSGGQLSGDCSGAHCWASFYDPARGWVPVDVSEADKAGGEASFFYGRLTPNRFQVSEGRGIVLDPPQGGDPLSTFAYAYAEADGIPLIYGSNYENVIQYEITGFART